MIDRFLRRHRAWHALITDAVSGRADDASLRRLEAHTARCAACRARLGEERALRAALESLPLRQPSRSLRLTPAMLEGPRPAPRAAVPRPLLLGARGLAAAAVAAFAVLAVLTVAAPGSDDSASLASRERAEDAAAPMAVPPGGDIAGGAATMAPFAATPESTPGLAPPPTGGAGASSSDRSPGPEPAPEPVAPAAEPGASAGDAGGEVRTTAAADDAAAGKAAPAAAGAESREPGRSGPPGWLLVAAGAAAALALASLAALEIARRRQP